MSAAPILAVIGLQHYLVLAARDSIPDIAGRILDRVLSELAERPVSDRAGTLAP